MKYVSDLLLSVVLVISERVLMAFLWVMCVNVKTAYIKRLRMFFQNNTNPSEIAIFQNNTIEILRIKACKIEIKSRDKAQCEKTTSKKIWAKFGGKKMKT